jgi:hypothetical protein
MIFHTLDKYNNFTLLGRNASRAARLGPFWIPYYKGACPADWITIISTRTRSNVMSVLKLGLYTAITQLLKLITDIGDLISIVQISTFA